MHHVDRGPAGQPPHRTAQAVLGMLDVPEIVAGRPDLVGDEHAARRSAPPRRVRPRLVSAAPYTGDAVEDPPACLPEPADDLGVRVPSRPGSESKVMNVPSPIAGSRSALPGIVRVINSVSVRVVPVPVRGLCPWAGPAARPAPTAAAAPMPPARISSRRFGRHGAVWCSAVWCSAGLVLRGQGTAPFGPLRIAVVTKPRLPSTRRSDQIGWVWPGTG